MWNRVIRHKRTIKRGLRIIRIKEAVEFILLGLLALCALLGMDIKETYMFFLSISLVSFLTHHAVLYMIGFYKACAFYGLTGHEFKRTIEKRIR